MSKLLKTLVILLIFGGVAASIFILESYDVTPKRLSLGVEIDRQEAAMEPFYFVTNYSEIYGDVDLFDSFGLMTTQSPLIHLTEDEFQALGQQKLIGGKKLIMFMT